MSKRWPASASAGSATRVSCWNTCTCPPARSAATLSFMARTASRLSSIITTRAAPREAAPRPTAPPPPNASRNRQPGSSGCRMSKRVCFTRAAVGRVRSPLGALSRRPLPWPEMMRVMALSDPGQAEAPLPAAGLERLLQRFAVAARARLLREAEGLAARRLHQLAVAQQVGGSEARQAPLPRAEDVARAAQLEVALGHQEPVARAHQYVEACTRLRREAAVRH